ncbi:hypothetical protein GCK32_004996, partial [Trichostrongylus colubriformis]
SHACVISFQLGIKLPDKLAVAAQKDSTNQNTKGDALASYIGGHVNVRPSNQDIVKHLQRSYMEIYERNERCPSRELVSLIDASLVLGVATFAQKLSEENNYEHDLVQIHYKKSNPDIWDDYKMSVMLRLSRGGAPSPEVLEAASITRLLCDLMAGPSMRRRAAIAEMAANGLKLDAMTLAKLYFPDSELSEQLSNECSSFFEESVNTETKEIVERVAGASQPVFNRHLLRCMDQLSCYRILRIDFALNEKAPLDKKLIGRLEISKHVRYVIADGLAHRNFEAVDLIVEDAVDHLDKYAFFSELEQIVYPMAIDMLSEAVRMIFHAKPASVGWKKQRDEGDKLGCALQQHPNGYIGGLVEMWLKRGPLIEISNTSDVYRQHSLLTSVEGIASVLHDDGLLNPICRGMLLLACDLVCSVMEGLFGNTCRRIDEIIRANPCLDHHTGLVIERRLTREAFDSRTNVVDVDSADGKVTCSSYLPTCTEEFGKLMEGDSSKDRCEGAMAMKRRGEEPLDGNRHQLQRKRLIQEESMAPEPVVEPAVTSTGSGQSSDMNEKNQSRTMNMAAKAEPHCQRRIKDEPESPGLVPPASAAKDNAAQFCDRLAVRSKQEIVGPRENVCQQYLSTAEDDRRDTERNVSQLDPSLKTKWLPGEASNTCDKTGEEAFSSTDQGDGKTILGFDAVAQIASEGDNELVEGEEVEKDSRKIVSRTVDAQPGDNKCSIDNGGLASADKLKNEHTSLLPPLSPGAHEGGRNSPHHIQIVDRGKAMIHKLLTENNDVNSRPRFGSERQCTANTKPSDDLHKTQSFADFTDDGLDQSNPFRATRENVFCTSSRDSVSADANSFDDDIAAAFAHPPDLTSKIEKATAVPANTTSSPLFDAPENQDIFPENGGSKIQDTDDGWGSDEQDVYPDEKSDCEAICETACISKEPVGNAGTAAKSIHCSGRESEEDPVKTSNRFETSNVLEAIREKLQKKFMSGGFGASGSSGFGSFKRPKVPMERGVEVDLEGVISVEDVEEAASIVMVSGSATAVTAVVIAMDVMAIAMGFVHEVDTEEAEGVPR